MIGSIPTIIGSLKFRSILVILMILALPLSLSSRERSPMTIGIVYPLANETYMKNSIQYQGFFHVEKVQWEKLSIEKEFTLLQVYADSEQGQIDAIDDLIESGAETIVFNYISAETARRAAERLLEAGIPAIAHGIEPVEGLGITVISYDNYGAGFMAGISAAEQLNKKNPSLDYPQIITMTSDSDSRIHSDRTQGFIDGVKTIFEASIDIRRVFDNGTTNSTKERLLQELEKNGQADLFFATSDYRGMGALRAIRLAVPEPETVVLASVGGSELSMSMICSDYDPWKVVAAFDVGSFVVEAHKRIEFMRQQSSNNKGEEGIYFTETELFNEPTYEDTVDYVKRTYGYDSWMPYCGLIDLYMRKNFDIPSLP